MFIGAGVADALDPSRARSDGEERLLVGGEGHRPGTGGDTEQRYERLEAFAREHWDVRSVDYRWSAQDNVTLDGVPYVGPLTPRADRAFMATGFAKWGMTGGTAAALLLADLLLDRESPWARLFLSRAPHAARLRAAARAGERGHGRALRGRPHHQARPQADRGPAAGGGRDRRLGGETVAGYRDERGILVAVSATCTHLGCRVSFNSAERSWDCPCHSSRFATSRSGRVCLTAGADQTDTSAAACRSRGAGAVAARIPSGTAAAVKGGLPRADTAT